MKKLSAQERRKARLVGAVLEAGGLDVEELAELLDVSVVTVYRDVSQLVSEGLVSLGRGYVEPAESTVVDLSSMLRSGILTEVKESFAPVISELIPRASSLMIDDSSSSLPALHELTGRSPLTVITNSLAVVQAVGRAPMVELHCLGGRYSSWSNSFYGARTVAEVERFRADFCLMSDTAITDGAVYNPYDYVAETKQAMLQAAQVRILVADHTKFTRRALCKTAELGDFDYLITDVEPSRSVLEICRESNTELIVVPQTAEQNDKDDPADA